MHRYVILEHEWNGVHYDLMLEHGAKLATWRLETLLHDGTQTAVRLPDHRMVYLEYEGKLSGDRGSVRRVAGGEYVATSISDRCWTFELTGSIEGMAVLRNEADNRWLLEWRENR